MREENVQPANNTERFHILLIKRTSAIANDMALCVIISLQKYSKFQLQGIITHNACCMCFIKTCTFSFYLALSKLSIYDS